ncbi:MAG: hypothetical protein HC811_11515 [Flammeovirgaceae bacterium]|nr:hypothetical protein [Flammeovirgaceae bacterium]
MKEVRQLPDDLSNFQLVRSLNTAVDRINQHVLSLYTITPEELDQLAALSATGFVASKC